MTALTDSGATGIVEWIGYVRDRGASLRSSSCDAAELDFCGMVGEDHGGLTRGSCVRVRNLYDTGTPIRNTRQITLLATEEIQQIADETGLASADPALLGANIVIRGIPFFTLIPPSSRLQFSGGATVTVDMENLPCGLPAREIEIEHPGRGRGFKAAASRRRGVTAWVEREGPVRLRDAVRLFIPSQPPWPVQSETDRSARHGAGSGGREVREKHTVPDSPPLHAEHLRRPLESKKYDGGHN